jgi:hypothetical protein
MVARGPFVTATASRELGYLNNLYDCSTQAVPPAAPPLEPCPRGRGGRHRGHPGFAQRRARLVGCLPKLVDLSAGGPGPRSGTENLIGVLAATVHDPSGRTRHQAVLRPRTSQWGDGYGEGAVATSTGLEAWGRSTSCQSFCVLGMPFPPTVPVHGTTHTPQADAPTPEAMPRPSELDHAHSEPGAWTTRPTPHQQRRREEPPATSGPAHSRSRGERHRGHRGAAQGPGQGPPPVPGLGSPGSFCVLDLPAETSFQVHRTDSQDRP